MRHDAGLAIVGRWERLKRFRRYHQKLARTGLIMRYRGVEYTLIQGIERGGWKWSAYIEGTIVTGNEQTRPAAVTAAEKAIDWALRGRTGPPLQPD
jgi:hypothetical protein